MQCEEFHERMNDWLDAGLQPSRDHQLRQHSLRCRECRSDLEAWQLIAQSVAPERGQKPKQRWRIALPVGLAAGLCLMLFGDWQPAEDVGVVVSHRPATESPASEELGKLAAVPPQWSDPKWIDRWADRVAMPFAPLSEGLSPLGRSFQTAFTLLVLPGEGSESEVQPGAQPLQSKVFTGIPEGDYT